MILPGERARSHRHSPHALRFVLDVPDTAYTVVDGTRIDMRPGDVLLTPGWHWHGHGNDGDRPGYWVDFLDVPTVQLLEPMRFAIHGMAGPGPTAAPAPVHRNGYWRLKRMLRARACGTARNKKKER